MEITDKMIEAGAIAASHWYNNRYYKIPKLYQVSKPFADEYRKQAKAILEAALYIQNIQRKEEVSSIQLKLKNTPWYECNDCYKIFTENSEEENVCFLTFLHDDESKSTFELNQIEDIRIV